jgi:protein involved in polysaccharide export with SLBB domain
MNVRRLLSLSLTLGLAACRAPMGSPLPPRTVCQHRAAGLGARDVINVVVFNEPSLSGEYRVGEDGTLDYPYLGRVAVSGMQASEVSDLLRQGLAEQTSANPSGHNVLVSPNVRVEIKELNSRRISVLGQVQHPGVFPHTQCLTVAQAISIAGGFTALAEKNQVRITRIDRNGARQTYVLRVEDVVEGRAPDFDIEPGDVIFVPESVT